MDLNDITPGGNGLGINPHSKEARILETSQPMSTTEESRPSIYDGDKLMAAIEEATKELPDKPISMELDGREYTEAELKELIKSSGPEGISFAKAVTRRKKAIRTVERLINKDELSRSALSMFKAAKRIVDNKELEHFIDTQIHYRNKLGISPQTKEGNEARQKANEEKMAEVEKNEGSQKRKLSDPQVAEAKKQAVNRPSTSKAVQDQDKADAKQPSAQKKVRIVDPKSDPRAEEKEALRVALVNTADEDGKVSEEIRNKVEIHILTELTKKANSSELYCEAGWLKGHRIFNCVNQASVDFIKEAVKDLNVNQGKVKIIPFSELHTVRQPRGWIWVQKPYLEPELVLNVVKAQNPQYNTSNWTIVTSGLKKPLGQHFLLKINKEDVEKLMVAKPKMTLKVGFHTSDVVMDDKPIAAEEGRVEEAPGKC